MNLLINASQAIEKKGEIKIKTWQQGDNVLVSVADNGQGIAEEHMEKLFEPFFTTKEVGQGTGLGLSIAYEIIQKHHGRIEVASERGVGTRFTITLPITTSVENT
jgi:signal transduction histidine kinase